MLERDYAKKPLTEEEIETIFGNDSILPFLNTRHAVYKERGYADALPARRELVQLIIAEPNLIRRPILRAGNHLVIGFDQTAFTRLVE
ncbi:MAG TPA: ArsC/Spx/MgsR family protein [Blastocatellia bacterium]|nr:ArsC/Spx/MgsR family protein [Blastocatellia bacterium]HMV84757.1 ArsC/Spx/MgsR family protein [Blastocatellia bacterium]HMX29937.1 ArsC/Spx/MgsR family protein [Blastocatellia bacterium]HMZ21721.1 ArsC/Spx/MgsR family protein [Blastocatellia bacterium]